VIASVTEPFCDHCNRVRITADGHLRTCLFSLSEHNLKGLLRSGATDEELGDFIVAAVWKKEAGHKINQPDFIKPDRSMSVIGG
jgi:cyclic pyranopterin phosphate synthase